MGYIRRPIEPVDVYEQTPGYQIQHIILMMLLVWHEGLTSEKLMNGTGFRPEVLEGGIGALNTRVTVRRTNHPRRGAVRQLADDVTSSTLRETFPVADGHMPLRPGRVLHLLIHGPAHIAEEVVKNIRERAFSLRDGTFPRRVT